jgi:hypothetical protein
MKALLAALAVTMLGLGVSNGAIWLGDRMTLVAPPEARAEAFLRELKTRRPALALKYLSRDLRRRVSPRALQRRFDELQEMIGDVEDVRTRTLSYDRQTATARAELLGHPPAQMALDFRFSWESGEWTIRELPSALTTAARGP